MSLRDSPPGRGKNRSLYGNDGAGSWSSMNPQLRDMDFMNGGSITKSHAILLLTLEEAQQILDDLLGSVDNLFSYTGPGNMKDGLDAFRNLSKLTTFYNPAQQLVFNFDVLKIKAVEFTVAGKCYIKITGYPGLRRILTGTRYAASHPQMLEMAIGRRGIGYSLVNGTRYCIYASLAWRAIELIFKSDYYLTDFLVDVGMDVAKILVSSVVIGVVAGIATLLSTPIIFIIGGIVLLGLAMNYSLNMLDERLDVSSALKKSFRDELDRRGYRERTSNALEYLHTNPLLKY